MKNTKSILGSFATAKLQARIKNSLLILILAVIGFTTVSCTTTTIGGASGGHGLISGLFEPNVLTKDAQKIESYLIIIGLFDVGFSDFANKVRTAERSGKRIVSVQRDFFGVVSVITAYSK